MSSSNTSNCPKYERKVAYADLTNSGKGILQHSVYNACVCNGRLLSAEKWKEYYIGYDIRSIAAFPDYYHFLMVLPDGLYYGALTGMKKILDGNFIDSRFLYHPSSQTMLFCADCTPTYAYKDGVLTQIRDFYLFSMTTYRDRCFGVLGEDLYFTEQGSAGEWTGHIKLPEDIKTLVSTTDGLYLVGRNVYLLNFDDNQPNSKLTLVYKDLGVHLYRSVQSVGKGFMFLNEQGVQYFNGSSVKNVVQLDVAMRFPEYVSSAACDGKYYAVYSRRDFDRDLMFVAIDIATQKLQTVFSDIPNCLWVNNTTLYAVCQCRVLVNDHKEFATINWQSRPYNFGDDTALKSLDTLLVDSAGFVSVCLCTETDTQVFRITGSKDLQKIPLHGSFRRLTLYVESDSKANINYIGVAANVYKQEV